MIDAITYENGKVFILDQTKLPADAVQIELKTREDFYDAIKTLKVRGAPAIGVAAAYSMVICSRKNEGETFDDFFEQFNRDKEYINSSRPTAVNLSWALERISFRIEQHKGESVENLRKIIEGEAVQIHQEDISTCKEIGKKGFTLLKDGYTVLTHCNAGRLAVSKYGTALAPIYYAKEKGLNIKVFSDETRPLLQGARLTCYELSEAGVDVTLITDNMAATCMAQGKIDIIFVGCDRVARNGDFANKIGTYGLAVLAKYHNIPMYTLGPLSTIDIKAKNGSDIIIEERDSEEVKTWQGIKTAPDSVKAYNPAFDVTPAELLTGIVTEKGIIYPPFEDNIKKLFR